MTMTSFIKQGFVSILVLLAMGAQASASEFMVKYRSTVSTMSFGLGSQNVIVMDHNPAGQLVKVSINDANKIAALIQLSSNPNVEYVVPNFKLRAFTTPVSTSALKSQWAIEKVQAQKAWDRAGNKGNRKVVVAVIDTGADYKHKNLAPNMIEGHDFIKNNNDPMDITGQNPGHGTHCSGIIGATGLIDEGTIGLSPEVSIMPLRFLDENGSGDLNNGVKAIDYAIEKKVDVISASWGAAVPRSQATPLIEAIGRAEKAGIIFVVAASNDGKNNDSYEVYPANAGLSNTLSVAASNQQDGKPSWSNYGRSSVHLSSPGDGIMSTLPKDSYGNLSGTSMATPLVAGLVAFVKAQDMSLNAVQIKSLLQATAEKNAIETACDCRVNAFNAVDAVLSKKMFVSPYAGTYAVGDKVQIEGVYGKAPLKYTVANATVADIDANGTLTAKANGDTTVTVTDSAGVVATSYKFYVGKSATPPPTQPDPGNPGFPGLPDPGQPGECPLGDPSLCQILCQISPTLPFCQK
jgi:thermitase